MRLIWLVLATALAAAPAAAQNPYSPALTVNQGVVTYYDVAQRARLIEALGARGDLQEIAIEQLTEDRVKVQAAEALGIELPEGAIETGVLEFAEQRGLTVEDVHQVLDARGIDEQTMTDFVEAGLLWREVVQNRFRQKATPTEEDLDTALALAATTPVESLQISEIALPFAERGEAETLTLADRLSRELRSGGDFAAAARAYSRSASAAQGGRIDALDAAALPPAVRAQVLLLEPGGVTAPIPISGGVAILKLNSVSTQSRAEVFAEVTDEEARNQLREQIFTQRMASFSQGYLQELLRDALILEPAAME